MDCCPSPLLLPHSGQDDGHRLLGVRGHLCAQLQRILPGAGARTRPRSQVTSWSLRGPPPPPMEGIPLPKMAPGGGAIAASQAGSEGGSHLTLRPSTSRRHGMGTPGGGGVRRWRETPSGYRGIQTPTSAAYPREGTTASCGSCRSSRRPRTRRTAVGVAARGPGVGGSGGGTVGRVRSASGGALAWVVWGGERFEGLPARVGRPWPRSRGPSCCLRGGTLGWTLGGLRPGLGFGKLGGALRPCGMGYDHPVMGYPHLFVNAAWNSLRGEEGYRVGLFSPRLGTRVEWLGADVSSGDHSRHLNHKNC